jgi:hypothetical protein
MQTLLREWSDRVPNDSPRAREIGFSRPERHNASEILFDTLAVPRTRRGTQSVGIGLRVLAALSAGLGPAALIEVAKRAGLSQAHR